MTTGASKHRRAFLAAYRITASITAAAKAAGIERQLHYRWMDGDPDYPALFASARHQAGDALIDEAVRRAHEGIEEPLTYKGQFTYPQVKVCDIETRNEYWIDEPGAAPLFIRKYSDENLRFLIKGFKPEFRERGTEAAGISVSGLTWEEFCAMYKRGNKE